MGWSSKYPGLRNYRFGVESAPGLTCTIAGWKWLKSCATWDVEACKACIIHVRRVGRMSACYTNFWKTIENSNVGWSWMMKNYPSHEMYCLGLRNIWLLFLGCYIPFLNATSNGDFWTATGFEEKCFQRGFHVSRTGWRPLPYRWHSGYSTGYVASGENIFSVQTCESMSIALL